MKKASIGTFCFMLILSVVTGAQAIQLQYNDLYYVGSIDDGIPSSGTDEIAYINALTNGDTSYGSEPQGPETLTLKSTISPNTLPDISVAWTQFRDTPSISQFTVPWDGDFYILGKYDGDNAGALVWFIDDALEGAVYTTPALFPGVLLPGGTDKYGVSHTSAYGFPNDSTPPQLPEPMSLLLLGFGLIGLAGFGRKFRK